MSEGRAEAGDLPNERASVRGEPDPFAELLSDTRGTGPEQRQAREAWFAELELDNKEDVLFELEVLLKGIACFANPRNHPGPPRRTSVVASDFSWHLAFLRDGVAKIVHLSRQLVGDRAGALFARRYLATTLPGYGSPAAPVTRGSPDESLLALRHALVNALEVIDGTLGLQRVPFRLFYAEAALIRREIAHNTHFNPLSALEFRPEFDRIGSGELRAVVSTVHGQTSRRLVAVTFLSLLRMARYARLVDAIAQTPLADKRQQAGSIYLVLAVLRSDARALSNHLQRRAASLVAASFEAEVLAARAEEIHTREEALSRRGRALVAVVGALDAVAASAGLEIRRMFERELPAPDAGLADDELLARLRRSADELVPAVDKIVVFLAKALGAKGALSGIVAGQITLRDASERMRRDVWSLAQIFRAFASKAGHARWSEHAWAGASGHAFVREFISYFDALGHPLLRIRDYPRLDALLAALAELRDADLLVPSAMGRALAEAQQSEAFLVQVFDRMSADEAPQDPPVRSPSSCRVATHVPEPLTPVRRSRATSTRSRSRARSGSRTWPRRATERRRWRR